MSQQELLARVIAVLEGAGIDYMVTGSVTSSLQGEPRSTHDIDIVVALAPSAVDAQRVYEVQFPSLDLGYYGSMGEAAEFDRYMDKAQSSG